MAIDREVIALAKTHTIETICDKVQRPPATVLKRGSVGDQD
jgi:hypothetical protein